MKPSRLIGFPLVLSLFAFVFFCLPLEGIAFDLSRQLEDTTRELGHDATDVTGEVLEKEDEAEDYIESRQAEKESSETEEEAATEAFAAEEEAVKPSATWSIPDRDYDIDRGE